MFDSLRPPPLPAHTIRLAPPSRPLTSTVMLLALGSLLWAAWLRWQGQQRSPPVVRRVKRR